MIKHITFLQKIPPASSHKRRLKYPLKIMQARTYGASGRQAGHQEDSVAHKPP